MARTNSEVATRQDMRTVPGDPVLRNRNEKQRLARQPTQDEIRGRAYEIYLERGGEPGREAEDWVQAEHDLKSQRSRVK
jgi:hypothetical protein